MKGILKTAPSNQACRRAPFHGPETMMVVEHAALLGATKDAPRDHLLYSMALGTGPRLSELLGLNVGDVSPDGREVLRRVTLDPATTKGGRWGEVFPSVCPQGESTTWTGQPGRPVERRWTPRLRQNQ